MPRIVYVPFGDFDIKFAEGLVPSGFELVRVSAGSAWTRESVCAFCSSFAFTNCEFTMSKSVTRFVARENGSINGRKS